MASPLKSHISYSKLVNIPFLISMTPNNHISILSLSLSHLSPSSLTVSFCKTKKPLKKQRKPIEKKPLIAGNFKMHYSAPHLPKQG